MEYFFYFFPIIFILVWLVSLFMLAGIGGWYKLSKEYPATDGIMNEAEKFYFQSIKLGLFTDYNSCVNVRINQDGIVLSVFFLFRFMHRPIYIRFSELQNVEFKSLFGFKSLKCTVGDKRIKIMGGCVKLLESKIRGISYV